jgi:outer membrane protein
VKKFNYLASTISTAAMLFCAPVLAQSYSLLDAYRDALGYDALLASAKSSITVARERSVQANAGLLPSVNASGNLLRQFSDTNLSTRREFTSSSYGINLSFPLYRLQNIEALEQSKLSVGLSEIQWDQARQDLMIRVAQAYFDILAAQDNLSTVLAQKRAITEQLAAAKRNFEVGTATITDQQEAQSRFDLVIAQELAIENDLATKRALLANLTGKTVNQIASLPSGVNLLAPQPADMASWSGMARDSSLAVAQGKVALEIATREIARQNYGHRPTVDLVSSLNRSQNSTAQFLGIRTLTGNIGVQVNLPVYAGGAIEARVRESIAARDKSITDLENTKRTVEQAARAQYLGVSSGLAQVKALEAAEKSSQLALDSNQLGYQVGVRINIDVLNAQQQLFTTRRDLSKARYDVLVNGLKLKQTAGTLTEQDLSAVNALLKP